ncbi:MAG TPA: phytase [Amycolatopsis sp.]|uniref:phytase n=1 Tax=Amycolatopsis sp. TaxID=37632 RepID=UPI002B46AE42|nr:phytase [Amycolatopsis sp.]HKS47248.1 phytase [Amycolatopsis sp.]
MVPSFQTRGFADDPAANPPDADDPAIWINRRDPARRLVLGTLKQGGLAAFDLHGHQVAWVPAPPSPGKGTAPGRFDNVDVIGELAVVSDRGRDRVSRSLGPARRHGSARPSRLRRVGVRSGRTADGLRPGGGDRAGRCAAGDRDPAAWHERSRSCGWPTGRPARSGRSTGS